MKTKALYIPLLMILNDLMISIPSPGMLILRPELTFESLRLLGFSLAGFVRLAGMPLLLLVILDSIIAKRVKKVVMPLALPIIGLLVILILQFFAIPAEVIPTHSTGIVRYLSWVLGYIALLSTLNEGNSWKVLNVLTTVLVVLFVLLIIQYPFIIANSGYSFAAVIQLYGQNIIKLDGIFAAANEDANGAIALLPFFLAYTEQQSGPYKYVLMLFALVLTPLMIFFNGTRTALFVSYPIVLFLFYSKLSVKRILKLSPILFILGTLLTSFGLVFAETAFEEEAKGGGTFGWRVERVWIPTLNYGLQESPLFGFGVRGWEFVCKVTNVVNSEGAPQSPHNIYLWAFISWGIAGLAMYLFFLATLVFHALSLSQFPDRKVSTYARASLCAIAAYFVWAAISNANIDIGWLFLILVASCLACLSVIAESKRQLARIALSYS